jgi:hypothetical protein
MPTLRSMSKRGGLALFVILAVSIGLIIHWVSS